MNHPIPDLPGYTVSSTGEVTGPRGVLKVYPSSRGGHLRVFIRRKHYSVHQLVLKAFGFPKPEGAVCRHLDGDPTNNSLSNLAWGTPRENYDDAIEHGRLKKTPRSEDIFACKYLRQFGLLHKQISDLIGIPHSTVTRYLTYV